MDNDLILKYIKSLSKWTIKLRIKKKNQLQFLSSLKTVKSINNQLKILQDIISLVASSTYKEDITDLIEYGSLNTRSMLNYKHSLIFLSSKHKKQSYLKQFFSIRINERTIKACLHSTPYRKLRYYEPYVNLEKKNTFIESKKKNFYKFQIFKYFVCF